jgi:hypothetical protein
LTLYDDPYSVLGLMRDATRHEADQRYRLLAERLAAEAEHDPAALDRLRAVNRAYQQLTGGAPAPGAPPPAGGAPPAAAPRLVLQQGPPRRAAPPATPRRDPPWGRRILVVGVVLALAAAGIYARLARPRSAQMSQSDIAVAYAGAVVAFEHDHAGRPPLLSTNDWPDKLAGPVNASAAPYLSEIPRYVAAHPFDVIQTRSRSGSFPSPQSLSVPVTSTTSEWVIQYVPYGRTFDLDKEAYVYEGYLVLVDLPLAAKRTGSAFDPLPGYCEAWADPVQVKCT